MSSTLTILGFLSELLDLVVPESSFFGLSFVLVVLGAAFITAAVIEITKKNYY
jgi:hypothetical protein